MDYYITRPSRITSPRLLLIVQLLLGLNAALWLISFLTNQSQIQQAVLQGNFHSLVITGIMGGNTLAMLAAVLYLPRPSRLHLYFTAVVVGINIMLAIVDRSGLFNPIILLVDLSILALLPMLCMARCSDDN